MKTADRPRKGHRQQIISLIIDIIKFLLACNFNVNLKDWGILPEQIKRQKSHYLMEGEYLIQDNCTVATLWQFLFSGKIAFLSWYSRTPSANIVHLHFNFFRNAFPKPNTRAPLLTTGMKGLNVRRYKWYWCLIYVNYSEFSRSVEQHCTGIWRNDTGRRTDYQVYFYCMVQYWSKDFMVYMCVG